MPSGLGGTEYMPGERENELQNGRCVTQALNMNTTLGRARLYIRGNERPIKF